ncbi:unnamed protein product, partial [marine sediment metagenome]
MNWLDIILMIVILAEVVIIINLLGLIRAQTRRLYWLVKNARTVMGNPDDKYSV